MTRTYLVQMPEAEARYLAGLVPGRPAGPETDCMQEIRDWLRGAVAAGRPHVREFAAELTPMLDRCQLAARPARGPFAPGRRGFALPGRVEYLGDGLVRLDEVALRSLAEITPGEDFRMTSEDIGPVIWVGADRYPAREEPGSAP
jgi:hypothetical protein